jgi:hypothetical protein
MQQHTQTFNTSVNKNKAFLQHIDANSLQVKKKILQIFLIDSSKLISKIINTASDSIIKQLAIK